MVLADSNLWRASALSKHEFHAAAIKTDKAFMQFKGLDLLVLSK
jgi:hypothetical protein